MIRRKGSGAEDASQDVMLPAGEAQRQVGLMQQLYRPASGVGQCQPCRGIGRISIRGGASQTCPKCQGRGRA